jgi:hypothetical protein
MDGPDETVFAARDVEECLQGLLKPRVSGALADKLKLYLRYGLQESIGLLNRLF